MREVTPELQNTLESIANVSERELEVQLRIAAADTTAQLLKDCEATPDELADLFPEVFAAVYRCLSPEVHEDANEAQLHLFPLVS